jgi:hypothetical protein
LLSLKPFCQGNNTGINTIKLTAGRIIFGTGDIFGYVAHVEYAKTLRSNSLTKHFAVGAEISFENGTKQPTGINPTVEEFFFGSSFRSTTNIVLTPKLTYYPFNRIINGLNITGGVSFGYTTQTMEAQATRIYDSVSQTAVRQSYLRYANVFLFGYRITTGYECFIKGTILGARLDFASYSNGDINTFYGLKVGRRF